jgi:hypothetical protein
MKPKVFVVQPIPEIALEILREAADVFVYPYTDRQISVDELVANAKRSDWLYVLPGTIVNADFVGAHGAAARRFLAHLCKRNRGYDKGH